MVRASRVGGFYFAKDLRPWQQIALIGLGLAAALMIRFPFEDALPGRSLFLAFAPAILFVTLCGGAASGSVTLFIGMLLSARKLGDVSAVAPERLLLWSVVGGGIVGISYVFRILLKRERLRYAKVLDAHVRAVTLLRDAEASAIQAAVNGPPDAEAARLAATVGFLRKSLENPDLIEDLRPLWDGARGPAMRPRVG
ncbi:MAG: hypothetical protein U1E87_06905 [Alphaproteobacteria bacterium]